MFSGKNTQTTRRTQTRRDSVLPTYGNGRSLNLSKVGEGALLRIGLVDEFRAGRGEASGGICGGEMQQRYKKK